MTQAHGQPKPVPPPESRPRSAATDWIALGERYQTVLQAIMRDTYGKYYGFVIDDFTIDHAEALRRTFHVDANDGTIRAAELPDLSVVATRDRVWIRNHPTDIEQWRCVDGSRAADWLIDVLLGEEAVVLRIGDGGGS
jgi:hypothetical protein